MMSYYLRVVSGMSGPNTQEVWKIEKNTAFRIDVTNAEHFQASPGQTIWDALRRQTSWFGSDGQSQFHAVNLQPGEYYRRMARPIDHHPTEPPGWNPGVPEEADFFAIAAGQLTALAGQLDRICQTIQPEEETFQTFGHDIRNLLILACTEVESHWRGVLVANGVSKTPLSTRDYVALLAAMRLDE